MAELRYPRFNTIYSNRDEAIKKLDGLTRSYGEPVAIRYYNTKKDVCVILAIFKGEKKGEYDISYDSNIELLPSIFTIEISKETIGNSDKKIILNIDLPENYIIDGKFDTEYSDDVTIIDENTVKVILDDEKRSDIDYIEIALSGRQPIISDIVIIKEDIAVRSYIYTSEGWQILSASSSENLILGDSVVFEKNELGESTLEVKTDNNTIIYSEEAGGLTVNKIYGGTF